jgi:HAE1 family hydrophobic/amphiphilic exporter-1
MNSQRAVLLEVTKTKEQDTLTVMAAVERFGEALHAMVPPGVEVVLTRHVASIVEDHLDMLLDNGLVGVILVFLVLWVFFSLRFSFWVAMGLDRAHSDPDPSPLRHLPRLRPYHHRS